VVPSASFEKVKNREHQANSASEMLVMGVTLSISGLGRCDHPKRRQEGGQTAGCAAGNATVYLLAIQALGHSSVIGSLAGMAGTDVRVSSMANEG
jgi:hypothetical protein